LFAGVREAASGSFFGCSIYKIVKNERKFWENMDKMLKNYRRSGDNVVE
jgi:hypothetical protein